MMRTLRRVALTLALLVAGAARAAEPPSDLPPARPPVFGAGAPRATWPMPGTSRLSGISGIGDIYDISPFLNWKTIVTPHFRITFPADLAETAERAAGYLEEAHRFLSDFLHWEAHYRVPILLIDNADLANGITSAVARFGIILYATPPDSFFSTDRYDDWLRLLCFHEYTHFLNIDATRGVYQILRYLVGDILLPNATWPSWMLEGLAVFVETRFTAAGRGRSPYYDMIVRAAVEAGELDTAKFITLDKVNGPNPYFPDGETAYLFGYSLMNQVAQASGDKTLGDMSIRSAGRFPFLINGNLRNLSGKDWYAHWTDWVASARARAQAELARIRVQPLTRTTPVTRQGYETLGSAISPDGKWIAYTQSPLDDRLYLWIRNLANGRAVALDEKIYGAGAAFAADSQGVFYSAIHKKAKYNLFSDLFFYDFRRRRAVRLTDGLRARDPDVARDGSAITFTVAEGGRTWLATAPLTRDGTAYRLGPVERLYVPEAYERVAHPKFSPDARAVVFSRHPNRPGVSRDDLLRVERDTRRVTALVSDGHYNRFPAFDRAGQLYFVSDATGVDNLFRLGRDGRPEMASNVTTGLWFPAFGPTQAYATVFTPHGADLMAIEPAAPGTLSADRARLEPLAFPSGGEAIAQAAAAEKPASFPVADYSVLPSLFPRQWLLVPLFYQNGVYIESAVSGFDAVDRHRYFLNAAYDTDVKQFDWLGIYSNRSLGADLTFTAQQYTASSTHAELGDGTAALTSFERKLNLQASLSYTFEWTYSALQPFVDFNEQRSLFYSRGAGGPDSLYGKGSFVPSWDLGVAYSDAESSRLAISPEEGRSLIFGYRFYSEPAHVVPKGLLTYSEYLRLFPDSGGHTVLVPSVQTSWNNRRAAYRDSIVNVQGRIPRLLNSLPSVGFDNIALRGYPSMTYYVEDAVIGSLDYRFPLYRAYRGWGTNPFFLQEFDGFVFGECAFFPRQEPGVLTLPSSGAGVTANVTLLNYVPLQLSAQFHYGFRKDLGGGGEAFVEVGLGNIAF